MKKQTDETLIGCPFCGGEQEFDKPGLAYHLDMYCEGIQTARDHLHKEHEAMVDKLKERRKKE